MIITNISIYKVAPADPRYPAADAFKRHDGSVVPFSEIYECKCTTGDGQILETQEFRFEREGPLTPELAGRMMERFASALSRMDQSSATEAA